LHRRLLLLAALAASHVLAAAAQAGGVQPGALELPGKRSATSSTYLNPDGSYTAVVAPQAVNYRGLRLPLVGAAVGLAIPAVAPVAAIGLADDLWSGPERGFGAHLRARVTTGTLKLVGIPLWALWRTRSPSGAVLVALCANVLNQLDTRPGRALKAFLLGSLLVRGAPRGAVAAAVLLAPYDHREMTMLGDAGSNALGAVLGLHSVRRLSGPRRIGAIGALAVLTVVADRRSLGELIESTPVLSSLDALGRQP